MAKKATKKAAATTVQKGDTSGGDATVSPKATQPDAEREALILAKVRAGLTREQALTVIAYQEAEDATA